MMGRVGPHATRPCQLSEKKKTETGNQKKRGGHEGCRGVMRPGVGAGFSRDGAGLPLHGARSLLPHPRAAPTVPQSSDGPCHDPITNSAFCCSSCSRSFWLEFPEASASPASAKWQGCEEKVKGEWLWRIVAPVKPYLELRSRESPQTGQTCVEREASRGKVSLTSMKTIPIVESVCTGVPRKRRNCTLCAWWSLFRGNFKTGVESERNLRGFEARKGLLVSWWDDSLAGKREQMTMAMAFKVNIVILALVSQEIT